TGLVFLIGSSGNAEPSEGDHAGSYARGAQSYRSGDYESAIRELSTPIAQGSTDPRLYYFRGLAYLRLHKDAEAQRDMEVGAALEAADPSEFYNIGGALQSFKGLVRMRMERYREEAGTVASQRRQQKQGER